MKVSPKQYAQMLFEATQGKSAENIQEVTKNFVFLLRKKHQLKHIRKILRFFNQIYNQEHNIVEAHVDSAKPLDEKSRERIIEYIQSNFPKSKPVLLEKVVPVLQGGIILRIGDEAIDGSVVKNLLHFKQHMRIR